MKLLFVQVNLPDTKNVHKIIATGKTAIFFKEPILVYSMKIWVSLAQLHSTGSLCFLIVKSNSSDFYTNDQISFPHTFSNCLLIVGTSCYKFEFIDQWFHIKITIKHKKCKRSSNLMCNFNAFRKNVLKRFTPL